MTSVHGPCTQPCMWPMYNGLHSAGCCRGPFYSNHGRGSCS